MDSRLLSMPAFALVGASSLGLPAETSEAERFEIRFDDHLGLSALRLTGPRASRRLDFWCEREWKPVSGSELHLFVEHSPELDFERSFLSVTLNHGILRSLRLDHRNQALTEVVIPLPAAMLTESNEIVLMAEQSGASDLGSVWTVVHSRSYISIAYERTAVAWTLAELPEPLLLRRSYRPQKLTLLLPAGPSVTSLEATALAVANLTARVAPEPVGLAFVRSPAGAREPVLAVGTPRELPSLQNLGEFLPLEIQQTPEGPVLAREGSLVAASEGVLVLLSADAGQAPPLLWLTGNSEQAVLKAAKSLFRGERPEGESMRVVREELAPSPKGLREWRRFIPPKNRFLLNESGDEDAELAVASEAPARVRLRATPDTRFLPWGNTARLSFQTLPELPQDPDAVLQIFWNDILLREDPIARVATASTFTLPVTVPAEALRKENLLLVSWSGRTGASGPFVMLQGDSEFYLPREYETELPDLARLKEFLYPFSLRADMSDVVVVPPENVDDDTFAAVTELAALIGRVVPADSFAFRVRRASELPVDRSALHFIWLETGESASGSLSPIDWSRIPGGPARERLPALLERESPWGGETKYLLLLRAPSPALLRAAVRGLAAPPFLERLSGDTALLASEGPLGFALEKRTRLVDISYFTRLEAWLRAHWLALPLILAFMSGLLFAGLELALGHYRAVKRDRRGESTAPEVSDPRSSPKGVKTRQ